MTLIKNVIKSFAALCIIFSCFSCPKNELSGDINGTSPKDTLSSQSKN